MPGNNEADLAPVIVSLDGTTADTTATPFSPVPGQPINLEITGTWVGSVTLKRKLPGASGWSTVTIGGVPVFAATVNCSEMAWVETEAGSQLALFFTRTSGTAAVRISQ